jgi:hypothetical protein
MKVSRQKVLLYLLELRSSKTSAPATRWTAENCFPVSGFLDILFERGARPICKLVLHNIQGNKTVVLERFHILCKNLVDPDWKLKDVVVHIDDVIAGCGPKQSFVGVEAIIPDSRYQAQGFRLSKSAEDIVRSVIRAIIEYDNLAALEIRDASK